MDKTKKELKNNNLHSDDYKNIEEYVYFNDKTEQIFVSGGLYWDREKECNCPIITNKSAIVDYSSIIECRININENDCGSSGLLGAAAGGLLFGGAGAITGAIIGKNQKMIISNIKIVILTRDYDCPRVIIPIIDQVQNYYRGDKWMLEISERIKAEIDRIITICKEKRNIFQSNISIPDEIIKYKNLMDQGIISSEEFETKKKQLLEI